MMQRTTLNWPKSSAELYSRAVVESSQKSKGRCAMAVAMEISFALWLMIGCAAAEATQLVEYLY
jgi:hypothetical protein